MTDSIYKLPKGRSSYEDVISEVKRLRSEMTSGQKGKLASTSFQGQAEMSKLTHEAFNEFLEWNGLFTFQESSAAKMENDILDICIGLVNGGSEGRANLTSGGTESNFNAFHAMRDWAWARNRIYEGRRR